jgi:hypothetical protein
MNGGVHEFDRENMCMPVRIRSCRCGALREGIAMQNRINHQVHEFIEGSNRLGHMVQQGFVSKGGNRREEHPNGERSTAE